MSDMCLFFSKGAQGVLAIRHIFSLVDMITNTTKVSNDANVFKIGVVGQ